MTYKFPKLLLNQLKEVSQTEEKVLIIIDGRGGSGKSTIALQLSEILKDALVIPLDAFTVNQIDLFHPDIIAKNFAVDFSQTQYDEVRISHEIARTDKKYIILEGCFSFKNLTTIPYHYSIWVETPREVAANRLNSRERNDPGRKHLQTEIIELSTKMWQKSEDAYITAFKPQLTANVVLQND
ncbi:MAG: shikimate kinase [Candidatus Dojkabacteria bacterium]|nr:MAG: shikimate kinase [Candidatus Dojkabacteria bacterium]